jgi:V8-like Glu-specific endopeptidase
MNTRLTSLVAACTLVLAAAVTSPPATASVGQVINGTTNPPLSLAAVLMDSDSSSCTGVLVLPNLLATAAHCFVDSNGVVTSGPEAWRIYPPGADAQTSQASGFQATQLLIDPAYRNDGTADARDLAYLVLNGALATPTVTRVATRNEVAALAARRAILEQVGYGQTVPRAVQDAPMSPIPIGMSAPIDEWAGPDSLLSMSTNGTTGTCAGDSGSPWMASVQGELLLVGVLSSGDGPPCDPEAGGTSDYVAVISGQPDLLAAAVGAAGAQPLTPPRTCIAVKGSKKECAEGRTWAYSFCWGARKYRVEQQVNGAWTTVSTGAGRKTRSCASQYPYLIEVTGTADAGTTRYRLVVPRQPSVPRTQYDPFTVTST